MYSNVIVGITISRGSFVFSQSRVKVCPRASLTNVGSLSVGAFQDLVNTNTTTKLTLLDETFTDLLKLTLLANRNPTPVTTLTTSYIKGTSETTSRILQPYNIRVARKPSNYVTTLTDQRQRQGPCLSRWSVSVVIQFLFWCYPWQILISLADKTEPPQNWI